MSEGPNVALLVVAAALAGAKLQDIAKHVFGRGRARRPVVPSDSARGDGTGPTRSAIARRRRARATARGSVEVDRGVDAPSSATLTPVRTITRKSIGSPQGVPPRARELALDAVVCARPSTGAPPRSSPRCTRRRARAAAGVPARKPRPLQRGRTRARASAGTTTPSVAASAQRSKDPNKQVGALLAGPEPLPRHMRRSDTTDFREGAATRTRRGPRRAPGGIRWRLNTHTCATPRCARTTPNASRRLRRRPGAAVTRASYPSSPSRARADERIMNKNSQNLVGATLYVTM